MALTFPIILAENLEKQKVEVPKDFRGKLSIVIVAFKQDHIGLLASWEPFLKELTQSNPDLAFYELPTLNSSYTLLCWWIDGGMRSGIRDKEARERTITLYTDKRAFKRQLKIPNESTTYLFLLKGGEVVWRTDDEYTEEKGKDLAAAIRESR
jgi:hypothetical protein